MDITISTVGKRSKITQNMTIINFNSAAYDHVHYTGCSLLTFCPEVS